MFISHSEKLHLSRRDYCTARCIRLTSTSIAHLCSGRWKKEEWRKSQRVCVCVDYFIINWNWSFATDKQHSLQPPGWECGIVREERVLPPRAMAIYVFYRRSVVSVYVACWLSFASFMLSRRRARTESVVKGRRSLKKRHTREWRAWDHLNDTMIFLSLFSASCKKIERLFRSIHWHHHTAVEAEC